MDIEDFSLLLRCVSLKKFFVQKYIFNMRTYTDLGRRSPFNTNMNNMGYTTIGSLALNDDTEKNV